MSPHATNIHFHFIFNLKIRDSVFHLITRKQLYTLILLVEEERRGISCRPFSDFFFEKISFERELLYFCRSGVRFSFSDFQMFSGNIYGVFF